MSGEIDRELCIVCDLETGRAGKSDDSIFVFLKSSLHRWMIGDHVGPICEKCHDAMVQLDVIEFND
jgi:hypothetical protein